MFKPFSYWSQDDVIFTCQSCKTKSRNASNELRAREHAAEKQRKAAEKALVSQLKAERKAAEEQKGREEKLRERQAQRIAKGIIDKRKPVKPSAASDAASDNHPAVKIARLMIENVPQQLDSKGIVDFYDSCPGFTDILNQAGYREAWNDCSMFERYLLKEFFNPKMMVLYCLAWRRKGLEAVVSMTNNVVESFHWLLELHILKLKSHGRRDALIFDLAVRLVDVLRRDAQSGTKTFNVKFRKEMMKKMMHAEAIVNSGRVKALDAARGTFEFYTNDYRCVVISLRERTCHPDCQDSSSALCSHLLAGVQVLRLTPRQLKDLGFEGYNPDYDRCDGMCRSNAVDVVWNHLSQMVMHTKVCSDAIVL